MGCVVLCWRGLGGARVGNTSSCTSWVMVVGCAWWGDAAVVPGPLPNPPNLREANGWWSGGALAWMQHIAGAPVTLPHTWVQGQISSGAIRAQRGLGGLATNTPSVAGRAAPGAHEGATSSAG